MRANKKTKNSRIVYNFIVFKKFTNHPIPHWVNSIYGYFRVKQVKIRVFCLFFQQ